MIKIEREQKILAMLEEQDILPMRSLYAALPEVSNVTVRRDVGELAKQGKLLRVRGGVRRIPDATGVPALGDELSRTLVADLSVPDDEDVRSFEQVDVIILPPIEAQLARTLQTRAKRSGVFCLDESWPDGAGTYLGVDNERAGFDVGCLAGQEFARRGGSLNCLVIGHDQLTNTRQRALGFLKGLRETFAGEVQAVSVDAGGIYMEAFRQARDALEAMPQIDVIFGINDHSALAAVDSLRLNRRTDVSVYCVGGEGVALFNELDKGEMLKGVAAMFPQVVARSAIHAVGQFFGNQRSSGAVITPHRIITPANLPDYFLRRDNQWTLRPDVLTRLAPKVAPKGQSDAAHSILFIRHYPAHDWYRILSHELEHACSSAGYEFHRVSLKSQVMDELRHTRREIAVRASKLVAAGDTISINDGEVSRYLARSLLKQEALTVATNSLAIMEILSANPGITVLLTGGKYRAESRDLIGPNMRATLLNIRIDTAFLSVDGISMDFGASCSDEHKAQCAATFAEFSRQTVVLADHSVVGEDANFKAVDMKEIRWIVTDFGVPAQQRVDYSTQGVRMIISNEAQRSQQATTRRRPGS